MLADENIHMPAGYRHMCQLGIGFSGGKSAQDTQNNILAWGSLSTYMGEMDESYWVCNNINCLNKLAVVTIGLDIDNNTC
jgi:hypothetical protein